jgi:hypothetical protein
LNWPQVQPDETSSRSRRFNLHDMKNAIAEMKRVGVEIVQSADI